MIRIARWLALFMMGAALATLVHAQTPQNAMTPARHRQTHLTGELAFPNPARTITVCDVGCDATVFSGSSCGSATDVTETAGSAMALARALSPSQAAPVRIIVKNKGAPYRNECPSIMNITDLEVYFEAGAYFEPFPGDPNMMYTKWSNGSDISNPGSVFRIANGATPTGPRSTARISIVGEGAPIAYSHAKFQGPAAAVTSVAVPAMTVGRNSCNLAHGTSGPSWDSIYLSNFTVVGTEGGLGICGANATQVAAAGGPVITLRDVVAAGSRVGAYKRGAVDVRWHGGEIIGQTNYCEADEATYGTFLNQVTGTVRAGDMGAHVPTQAFIIDPNQAAYDGFYHGRDGILTDADGGGAGVCGAGNACNNFAWNVEAYDKDGGAAGEDVVITDTECAVDITTGCAYTLYAVPKHWQAPCRLSDWTLAGDFAQAGAGGLGQGEHAAFAMGVPTVDNSAYDRTQFLGTKFRLEVNDLGPVLENGSGLGCQIQSAILINQAGTNDFGFFDFRDVDIDVEMNADITEEFGGGACTTPWLAGIAHIGDAGLEGGFNFTGRIRIHNAIDNTTDIAAVYDSGSRAGSLNLWDVQVIRTDGGSGSGTDADIWQDDTGAIKIGDIRKDGALSVTGAVGGLRLGLVGSSATDFASITAPDCSDSSSVTVTGAAFGDHCSVSNGAALPADSDVSCIVTAANTAVVRHCCGGIQSLVNTAVVDFADLVVADCADSSSVTVTGAAFGDPCVVGMSAAIPAESSMSCRVTADNTAVVRHCCSGAANCDPNSMTYTLRVNKYPTCDPANMTYTVSVEKK